MTADNTELANDSSEENSEVSNSKKSGISLWVVINVVMLLTIGSVVWFNVKSINSLENDRSQSELIFQHESSIQSLTAEIRDINFQLQEYDSVITELSQDLEQSNESLQILYQNQNTRQGNLSIAEVEHLIKIANLKISLENNIEAAIIALEQANEILASLGDPALLDVRRLITSDINALRSIPRVDITGISLALSDIILRIDRLSLKEPGITGDGPADAQIDPALPAWRQLMSGVWKEFKSMFIITRTGEGISSSLLPNEKYFLYQNLRLQLESSRFAVLQRNTTLLDDSLDLVESWLNMYFDTTDAGVIHVIQTIDNIRGQDLYPELPDINASLVVLNSYINENQDNELPGNGGELP